MKYEWRAFYPLFIALLVFSSTAMLTACSGDDLVVPEPEDDHPPAQQNGDDKPQQNSYNESEDEESNDSETNDSTDDEIDDPSNDQSEDEESDDDELVEIITCDVDADCLDDEACTQGGHCVNVTGDRDATGPLRADFDNLDEAVGLGLRYQLPENAHLQLNDIDGSGVALALSTPMVLEGGGSLLEVENGVVALRIGPDADRSTVRNLAVEPQQKDGAHDGIGIDVRAQSTRLDNLRIEKMGIGVRAHTNVDGEYANINYQQWTRLVLHDNYQAATDLSGEDAHGGLMKGIEVDGGNGIYDDSLLGNTWVGVAIDDTDDVSMYLGSDIAHHTVLGAYIDEDASMPGGESRDDMFMGGDAIDRFVGPGDRIGMRAGRLRLQYRESPQVSIPGHADAALGFQHSDEDDGWYFRYFDDPGDESWGLSYDDGDDVPFGWTGDEHPDGAGLFEMGETVD